VAKAYTKTGDAGSSGLIGERRPKSDLVFEVLGTVDELSATLGLLHHVTDSKLKDIIITIQTDLFEIGSFIAGKEFATKDQQIVQAKLEKMERQIDALDKENEPLKSFILPGGTVEAGYLHLARVVSRRLERHMVTFVEKQNIEGFDPILSYANRLSTYLFVLARYYNQKGKKDIIWKKQA
jgi:cob(I)alamin adenosyltransferase